MLLPLDCTFFQPKTWCRFYEQIEPQLLTDSNSRFDWTHLPQPALHKVAERGSRLFTLQLASHVRPSPSLSDWCAPEWRLQFDNWLCLWASRLLGAVRVNCTQLDGWMGPNNSFWRILIKVSDAKLVQFRLFFTLQSKGGAEKVDYDHAERLLCVCWQCWEFRPLPLTEMGLLLIKTIKLLTRDPSSFGQDVSVLWWGAEQAFVLFWKSWIKFQGNLNLSKEYLSHS